MNITQEKKNNLEAVIKINLTEDDYKDKIEKGLKEMQKNARISGFRPGKAPMGMIRKMYEKSIKADEINKLLVDSVYDYVKEQNLNIIGSPIPNVEEMKDVDWDNQSEFDFSYDIGFAPEVNIDISEGIKVDFFNIKATDKIIDEQITELRKRYGKMSSPDVSQADDVLFGEFIEMEDEEKEKEDGVRNKTNLYIQYLKDEAVKGKFVGLKKGDHVVFEPLAATENETETAQMLGVKKEELATVNPFFKFIVDSVSRVQPAEINVELFNKVAPDKEIKDEKELRSFIAEQIESQLQLDADKHFKNDAIKTIVEKANMELPEEFMKKWLLANNKGELTREQVDKEFHSYADSFRWQFIENHLIKEHDLQVKEDEIKDHLRDYFKAQMKQYGQDNLDDNVIDDFVKRILEKEDEVKKVYERIMDDKLLNLLKAQLKLKTKDVSFDDFVNLMTEKYKNEEATK